MLTYPENLTRTGAVPVSRVRDAEDARSLLFTLIEDDSISSYRRAQIQGQIDGNSPFNEQQLRELNQAERINVNWGHAEGMVENAKLPYFDMITSVPTYATVRTAYGKNPEKRDQYSRTITDKFHNLLKTNNNSFLKCHQRAQSNIVIQGPGCLYFPDEIDWRAKAIDPWNLIVPRGASVDWSEWEFCFVMDEMYAEQLYRYVESPEKSARLGWNSANCKDSILEAKIDEQDQRRPWEWYQKELKNNGLYYSYAKSKVIKVAHLYIREFDGRISHQVFDRLNNTGWLCRKLSRYTRFDQALTVFLNGIGNGYFHGVRGLGQKVFKYGDAMNRVNCGILEKILIDCAMMFQATSANDVSRIQSISIGPYRVIPAGLNVMEAKNQSALSGAMQAAAFFQGQEANQISSYMPTVDQSGGKKKTSKEVEMELGEKSRLTNTRAEIYLQDLDLHYAEVYRRACNPNLVEEDPGGKEALIFQRECKKAGVPAAALLSPESVTATRGIGNGSSAARVKAMEHVSQFLSQLPENKRKNVINASIAAITGNQSSVDQFGIDDDSEKISGESASIASLENNAFMGGGQVVLDPNCNHYIHCAIHLKFFGEVVKAVQSQQMDPRQADTIFRTGGPHLMLHLKYLAEDPTRKQQFEQFNEQASEVMKIADAVKKMAEEEEEKQQQSQQPQSNPQEEVARNKMQLDRDMTQNRMMIQTAKAKQQMMLKDRTTAQNLELKRATTTQKMYHSFADDEA